MFVASRVESGDEGKAVAALLPQVIGHIQTRIGCGTLRRASGIAVQVVVGDPVCQGDVIETAADGRIGIRFIDGTVFNLFNSTRVVLNEFVCDSNGSSRSALFGVTRGTFAFIAGEVAKTGCLRIDTPVGSIRGRAHSGGIGMLSLVALTFSILKEVQAADSNVTFLDDDSITYKDLEHGAFELVTKEAIPRHIIVEDPGETIVLSAKGSTISVNQVANTATRMAELQAAQQDVLANFAKGFGPTGSSTPAFGNPLKLQPINFIQTNDPSAPQNSLPPLPWLVDSTAMILFVNKPPPPPSLNAVTGPTEIDTAAFDFFTATSGTFLASSPNDGATLTYGISGGTAGSTVLDGVTYDLSKTGPYGTLYVNSTTGAYTFVPDSGAINALTTTTTASFTVTVSDGTLSANQTFTVTIHGTNDPAIISGTTTGSVIEAGGVANATPGTPTTTGTLTDTDVDNTPNTFTAVTSPTASAGGYGTFTMTAAGVWTYTLDNANSAVQALNVGDTFTDTFTVTTVDGTAKVVTITINGSNDAAIISGTTTGSVIEAGGVANATLGTLTATGTLTDTDVDNPPNTFTAENSPKASAGGYGTFTMTAAGVWIYTLDNANSAVQALNVGGTLTDTFTVATVDGTAQVVTITITGSNDAAIISGTTTGSVIEAGGVTPGTPTAAGTLTDTDVDNMPNTFTAVSSPTASAGGYGTFAMTAAGVWTYMLDDANNAVQALDVGDTLTDTFTVTTVDGTVQVVTIAIHGASDADPNDFDYLATGTAVISHPPYVYGTPGGDSIAGGGDEGQIIYGGAGDDTLNGTGKGDIIYAGSGNDTVKGNDGDDTIYGGSGNDTINANNGNDTIVGGFGADHLTGSNGDDRFVYLSVADSNAAQFDTISDFKSGSDRIDVAALGALAFLALTSTSTSVPAHTIAWLYDSASNETIVYVNPTDQTLSIGNSGLLEIHLQGIVTIQASDFIYEPTTAPVVLASDQIDLAMAATADGTVVTTSAVVSSDSTVSDGALNADWNWMVQTTKEGFSFDAARDQINSIGYARFTSSDEVRTQPTEYTDDDAVITLASGQSIELQRVHVTDNFAFDQSLVPDSAGAMTIGNGAVMARSGTIHSTAALNAADDRAELQLIKHGLALEDGDRIVPSHSDKINSGTSSIATNNEDHRALKASENGGGGNHSISGEASEHGTAPMHGAGAPDFEPSSTAHAVFGSGAAGTLGHGDSFHFKDKISGFEGSGVIDLADVDHAPASISHRENAAGTRGPEGAQTTELSLPGQHSVDNFSIVPDHTGGAVVTHVLHDLMV